MYFLFKALFWEISNTRRYAIPYFGPQNISRHHRAVTARKCTEKSDALAELLFNLGAVHTWCSGTSVWVPTQNGV